MSAVWRFFFFYQSFFFCQSQGLMWDLFCNDTGNLIIEPKTCDCTEHICWVYTSPRHLFCWAFKTFTVLIFFIRHFVEWKAADSVFNWNTLSVWKLCSLSVQLAVRTIQSFTLFIFFLKSFLFILSSDVSSSVTTSVWGIITDIFVSI